MYPLLTSTGIVAIAEIGDKTQLLALLLACRFRRPVPIALGILVATVLNHAAAAWAGEWIAASIDRAVLQWALALLFVGMAGWVMIPDKPGGDGAARLLDGAGPFIATAAAFFLAEIGDKTQIATAALAARFETVLPVVIGTTIGMMIADIPPILLGDRAGHRLNLAWLRWGAAALFAALGVLAIPGFSPF